MAAYTIPLIAGGQSFIITLSGVEYRLKLAYQNAKEAGWVLNISDATGDIGNPIICGIPLVTGVDLLAQYAYLNLGGKLIVKVDDKDDAMPTYNQISTATQLYFITKD